VASQRVSRAARGERLTLFSSQLAKLVDMSTQGLRSSAPATCGSPESRRYIISATQRLPPAESPSTMMLSGGIWRSTGERSLLSVRHAVHEREPQNDSPSVRYKYALTASRSDAG